MEPQYNQYSEMPKEEWAPKWSEQQLKQYIASYKVNPRMFKPEMIQEIKNHSGHYNIPFYEGEFSLTDAFKEFGKGLIAGFTTYDPGGHPDNEYEGIAKSLGHLVGFVPGMLSAPLKALGAAGWASRVGAIKSVPMWAAGKITKKVSSVVSPAVQTAQTGRAAATRTAANFLSKPVTGHIAEGAFNLGVASGLSSWQQGVDGMVESFFGGAIAGGVFRGIGNAITIKNDPKATKMVRAMAGSLFMGLPATIRGATTAEQVYEYLLGAYFGGHETGWKRRAASQFVNKMNERAKKDSQLEQTMDPKSQPEWQNLDKGVQRRIEEILEPLGVPEYNRFMGEALIRHYGLEDKITGDITKQSWDALKEVKAGLEVQTEKKPGTIIHHAISGGAKGADTAWAVALNERGVVTTHYIGEKGATNIKNRKVPGIIRELSRDELSEATRAVKKAAETMSDTDKPYELPAEPYVKDLIFRNYHIIKYGKPVYAIGWKRGDSKVEGGTGWGVEMAKQMKKPIFLFDQATNKWNAYDYSLKRFKIIDEAPKLSKRPAVIGSRDKKLTEEGRNAIENVVAKTFGEKVEEVKPKEGVSQSEINVPNKQNIQKLINIERRIDDIQEEMSAINEVLPSANKADRYRYRKDLVDLEEQLKFAREEERVILEDPEAMSKDVLQESNNFSDSDIGMKIEADVGRKGEAFVNEHLSPLWKGEDKLSLLQRYRLGSGVEEIIQKHTKRGEEPDTDSVKLEIETWVKDNLETSISLTNEAVGSLRQWMNIKNNGQQTHFVNIVIENGRPVLRFANPSNPRTPTGKSKENIEPPKIHEEIYTEQGGTLGSVEGAKGQFFPERAIVVINSVSDRMGGTLRDFTLNEWRANKIDPQDTEKEPAFYKTINDYMNKKGYHYLGGKSETDNLYYVKYHPKIGKHNIKIDRSDPLYEEAQKEWALRYFIGGTEGGYKKGTENFDKIYESNVLYEMGLNGLEISQNSYNKLFKIGKYKDADFIPGAIPYTKRLQIMLTPSWPGSRRLAKEMVDDLVYEKDTIIDLPKDLVKHISGIKGAENVEVFGSTAKGKKGRDYDILVDLGKLNFGFSSEREMELYEAGMRKEAFEDAFFELMGESKLSGIKWGNPKYDYVFKFTDTATSEPEVRYFNMGAKSPGELASFMGGYALKDKKMTGATDVIKSIESTKISPGEAEAIGEGKFSIALVENLNDPLLKGEFENLGNPEFGKIGTLASRLDESVDGAIIGRDGVINYMNKDAGMPLSGQNKSFIHSRDPEHGALLGKYMVHSAGPKLSAEMRRQGKHFIVYQHAAKQRGTRTIGKWGIKNGEIIFDKNVGHYLIDPADFKYNYSVKQGEEFYMKEKILVKQMTQALTQSIMNPVDSKITENIFRELMYKNFMGEEKWNKKLENYLKNPNPKELNGLLRNIDKIGINDLLRALNSNTHTPIADLAYQRLLKMNRESIIEQERAGDLSREDVERLLDEQGEFHQTSDRMIKIALGIEQAERAKGREFTSSPVMLHKHVNPYREKVLKTYIMHTITNPKINNSMNIRMRPYDIAARIDYEGVNPKLKELETRDDIFFLDDFNKDMPLTTSLKGKWGKTTLGKLWEKYLKEEAASKKTGKKSPIMQEIDDVLTSVVLRVPMDSMSGADVLKFRGFTGRPGHGGIIHGMGMRKMGGADLDGDEAFIYFGGRNEAGQGGGFKKSWKEPYLNSREEFVMYRHLEKPVNKKNPLLSPEEYQKLPEYKRKKYVKYIADPKSGEILRPDGKYAGKTWRWLLTKEGISDEIAERVAKKKGSMIWKFAPGIRMETSQDFVQGRAALGSSVIMPQIMKQAHSQLLQSGEETFTFKIPIKLKPNMQPQALRGSKKLKNIHSAWTEVTVTITPKGREWAKYQSDISQSIVAFAADPMDEGGLRSHSHYAREMYDAFFNIKNVSYKLSAKDIVVKINGKSQRLGDAKGYHVPEFKYNKENMDVEHFNKAFEQVHIKEDGISELHIPGIYKLTKNGIYGKLNEMNNRMFSKNHKDNRMWDEKEVRDGLEFLYDIAPKEQVGMMLKQGSLLASAEKWSDSILNKIDPALNENGKTKLEEIYDSANELAKNSKWLAKILGKEMIGVPYTNLMKYAIQEGIVNLNNREAIAQDMGRFKKFLSNAKLINTKYKPSDYDTVEKRLDILNTFKGWLDGFLVTDANNIATLRIIEPYIRKKRESLKGEDIGKFDRMLQRHFKKADALKKSSYLKKKDRVRLDKEYLAEFSRDEDTAFLKKLEGDLNKVENKLLGDKRSSTLDQVEIDAEISKYKKKLKPWEKRLFDYFLLGSWDKPRIRGYEKALNIIQNLKNRDPFWEDLAKYVRIMSSNTSLSKLGFSSSAVKNSSIGAFLKEYSNILGKSYRPNEIDVEKSLEKSKELDKPQDIKLGNGEVVNAKLFDSIDEKVEGIYSTDLSGYKGLSKGELKPEDRKLIMELAHNIKYNFGPHLGLHLNEAVSGIMHKDINAMNRQDFIALNNYFKMLKNGTVGQKLEAFLGKSKEYPKIEKRTHHMFPETVDREVMKYDINWVRKKAAVLTADGDYKIKDVRKPSWFLESLQDVTAIMGQQGTQKFERMEIKLDSDLLPYVDALGARGEVLRTMAWHEMENQFEVGRLRGHEKHIAADYIENRYNEYKSKKNTQEALNREYIVTAPEGRVKLKGDVIVERIMDIYEKHNKEAYKLINGVKGETFKTADGKEKTFEDYIEGYWDGAAKKEPRINVNLFLKDMSDLYKSGKGIPDIFGITGLHQVGRSMQIENLDKIIKTSKNKKTVERAKEYKNNMMQAKLARVGQLNFRGYVPHTFVSSKESTRAVDKAMEKIINLPDSVMSKEDKNIELSKLMIRRKTISGDWIDPNQKFWDAADRIQADLDKTSKLKAKEKLETIKWWDSDLTTSNMLSRGSFLPGYSYNRNVYNDYLKQTAETYYKQFSQLFTRQILGIYKDKALKKGWYNIYDYGKDNFSLGQQWEKFLQLSVQDFIGHPQIIPEKVFNDPGMKIKGTPYGWWSDSNVTKKLQGIADKLISNPNTNSKVKKWAKTIDWRTIHNISRVEAKFELASLLAHPKSAVANIFGGSMHTIQSAGWGNFRKATDYNFLQKINPKWKTKEDVNEFVIEQGIIPELLRYEWSLDPSMRTANGRKFLEALTAKLTKSGEAEEGSIRELAKRYNLEESFMKRAAYFMSKPEQYLRRTAFMSHYIEAYEKFGGAIKEFDHPILVEYAKKGVKATQFLYNAPYRPGFARSGLGKIMSRFMLWSWNAVRFRNDVIREAKMFGLRPGSPAFERFKRTAQLDLFVFSLANVFAYSLFETALPAPWNYLQDMTDWIFGNEHERDRAFYGAWPTPVAFLQPVTPPIMRLPLAGLTGFVKDDYSRLADYHVYTMFPFGRIARDFSPWAPGNLIDNPVRLLDKWAGIPVTTAQRQAKKRRDEGIYKPWGTIF